MTIQTLTQMQKTTSVGGSAHRRSQGERAGVARRVQHSPDSVDPAVLQVPLLLTEERLLHLALG